MKFWQKAFLGFVFLLVVAFDIGAYILVSYSYNFSLKSETASSVREQTVIQSALINNIAMADKLYSNASTDKKRLASAIEPLANYYSPSSVYLALFMDGIEVYSNTPAIDKKLLKFTNIENRNIVNRHINDKRYLYVASKVPSYKNLYFVYVHDISSLDSFRFEIGHVFAIVSACIYIGLGLSIIIFLKRLMLPVKELNQTTTQIANGDYTRRVKIHSKDEFGELGGTFNIMADSIEEKVAELTKATEDKQQLVDNLAHELKTPLTAILGYSEYLQRAVSNEEDRIKAAGHLQDAADRLKRLSSVLLNMTYLRATGIEPNEVHIAKLFSSLENLVSPLLKEHNLNLEISFDIDTVLGDETLLLSLLTNLVENAVRASEPNKTIKILAYEKEAPIFEVTDSGCGISKEEIEKITEPFYRVDKSRSRDFGGVGLGLSLCKQIVFLHGAALDIASTPGIGTTVRVIFTTP